MNGFYFQISVAALCIFLPTRDASFSSRSSSNSRRHPLKKASEAQTRTINFLTTQVIKTATIGSEVDLYCYGQSYSTEITSVIWRKYVTYVPYSGAKYLTDKLASSKAHAKESPKEGSNPQTGSGDNSSSKSPAIEAPAGTPSSQSGTANSSNSKSPAISTPPASIGSQKNKMKIDFTKSPVFTYENSEILDNFSGKYELSTVKRRQAESIYTFEATLKIPKVEASDFTHYECTAWNWSGGRSLQLQLIERESPPTNSTSDGITKQLKQL